MKPYYHAHESAYQQIKAKGFVGWGDKKTLAELGDAKTVSYLKDTVSRFIPAVEGKSALDVGCGTGTTAFTLSELGFTVTGIDISETAIQMGQELAKEQNLQIDFVVDDLLKMESVTKTYDLIYDSHCLHCIVFENDRTLALSNLKKSLAKDGIFILDTMVLPEEPIDPASDFDTLRFDQNYILWHKTKSTSGYGIREVDGQFWCAQRRIYPPDVVLSEIKIGGFEILSQETETYPGTTSMLRLVLRSLPT